MTVKHFGQGDVGGNSPEHFANETGGLGVVWLWFSERNRELELSFRNPLPGADTMTLKLDELSLAFPAGSSGKPNFKFKDADITWTDGAAVAASIVRYTLPPHELPRTALSASGDALVAFLCSSGQRRLSVCAILLSWRSLSRHPLLGVNLHIPGVNLYGALYIWSHAYSGGQKSP